MTPKLHYEKHGFKADILLCFHGFGQDNTLWDGYYEDLISAYTIYSFDIFYHGQSIRDANYLTNDEWNESLKTFLNEQGINNFSILGFSLGGRFSLSTFYNFPDRVNSLILIAPDGIHRSFWYKLANSTLGNLLFKYLMYTPGRFESFVTKVEKTGLVRESLVKFAARELKTMENKDRVFKTWTYFSTLQLKPKQWLALINETNLKALIILGGQDSIVRPKDITDILKNKSNIEPSIIQGKHHHLVENSKSLVASFLLNSNS